MGHKAMWHPEWNGYPSADFLSQLDPALVKIRESLGTETFVNAEEAGKLCKEWALRLGLNEGISVCVGALDAHIGAIGGGARENWDVKVMGTSTCDLIVSAKQPGIEKCIRGICGQVDGSVIPGFLCYEAGQSSFGDVYIWLKKLLMWPVEKITESGTIISAEAQEAFRKDFSKRILAILDSEAEKLECGGDLVALDWFNGRRTPDVSAHVTAAITGLTLGTSTPRLYRALVEATAFGSRAIAERLAEEGVKVEGIIAVGGIARKSPFVVQTTADVLNMPIAVPAIDQTGSLGAAMCAAVCAGLYTKLEDAQKAMGVPIDKIYQPDPERVTIYNELYKRYTSLGAFTENSIAR